MADPIRLGDRVKHRISGYQGIASGITEYLNQCRQVLVMPEKTSADGGMIPGTWLDEPWLDILERGVHAPKATVETPQGERVSGAPDRPHPPERRS